MNSFRSIAVLCAALLIASCFGSGDENTEGTEGGGIVYNSNVRIVIDPATVVVRQGESVTIRVDTPGAAQRDLPSGFAFDLDEALGKFMVDTAPCPYDADPTTAGTLACEIWTIKPLEDSVPGRYDVLVRTVGSRAGTGSGNFNLHVLLAPTDNGAAVSVRASNNYPNHVLVLNESGQVFVKGENGSGQAKLGYRRLPVPGLFLLDENGREVFEPRSVTEFVAAPLPGGTWTSISTAYGRSYAVRDDGSAWSWGDNESGVFGYPPVGNLGRVVFGQSIPGVMNAREILPAGDEFGYSYAIFADETVSSWQGDSRPPAPLCEEYVVVVDDTPECLRFFAGVRTMAGSYEVFAPSAVLKADGTVWNTWQVPVQIVEADNPAVSIALDGDGNLVIARADGRVWVKPRWENHIAPQAGLSGIVAVSARQAGSVFEKEIFALDGAGVVWTWNTADVFEGLVPRPVPGLPKVVALGANYAIAEDCQYRGMLWRIERIWPGNPYAVRVPGFGATKEPDPSCEPEPTHKLTVTVSGQGRIVSAPAGIDCPGSCEASFPHGTELRLYAAPEAAWTFSQWEGAICPDGSADTPVDVIIENASTCGATFAMGGEHRLTVRVEGGGRVTSDLPGIDCGLDCIESYPAYVDVTLEGHPDLGYRFERITGHDDCEDRNLVMDGVRSCVALFGALPAPAAPSGFMASAAPIVVQLRWDGVNGPVVRYTLERANASGTFVPISSDIAGTASTFADITAVANTTYTYRLTAHNHSGASTPVTATVTTGVLPPQPQRGWYELGKELSVTTEGPQSPSIAVDANGLPTVAYVETTANIGRLFVRRFDGTTWQTLGGSSLNPTSATSASNPSLVLGADANPRVAFSQGDGQQQNIYVAAFDGQDWGHLGPPGVPLNQTSGSNAVRPSLARVGNDRYTVAWIENGAVKVKTYAAATGAWDSYGMDGPISANASAVELAIAPNNEPVVAWRENVNSLSELRVSRGFDMRFIGIVTGPVPATDLRDFGLIVETDQPGSPLVAFGQGVQPWSIRARRHDGTDWLQLSDVLTGVQAPLQAMAMHRSSINQGVAVTYQARGNESDLVIYRRDNTEWIPTGTTYPLKTSPQLSLAMATNLSPVVAVVENDAGTFRLRVFRYFP